MQSIPEQYCARRTLVLISHWLGALPGRRHEEHKSYFLIGCLKQYSTSLFHAVARPHLIALRSFRGPRLRHFSNIPPQPSSRILRQTQLSATEATVDAVKPLRFAGSPLIPDPIYVFERATNRKAEATSRNTIIFQLQGRLRLTAVQYRKALA
jgi:hypothetical protein